MELISIILSILAFIIAGLTYWDNSFHFKLNTKIGKQSKLIVVSNQPAILINIALINTGGKTAHIDDLKLIVKMKDINNNGFETDFIPTREFEGSFDEKTNNYKFSEVQPIVIIGRTSILKKFVFTPLSVISQVQIKNKFLLTLTLYTKYNGKWSKQKREMNTTVENVWLDLLQLEQKNLIIELREKT